MRAPHTIAVIHYFSSTASFIAFTHCATSITKIALICRMAANKMSWTEEFNLKFSLHNTARLLNIRKNALEIPQFSFIKGATSLAHIINAAVI
jgi:hypothetical protein